MPTLTNSASLSVGAGTPGYSEATITLLPAAPATGGMGRLIHPTLGTLDYEHPPTSWTNLRGGVIVPPVWASSKTLQGSANTLFAGALRDVTCVERWTGENGGELRMLMSQLDAMIAMYVTPPDPAVAAVQWWPNYESSIGYLVALTRLTVGGQGITLDWVSHASDYDAGDSAVTRDVELQLQILGLV